MTKVFCTLKFEGTHCYPDAPEEVRYLRDPHRHMFGVRVEMEVHHDDRDIEFIMMKHVVQSQLHAVYPFDPVRRIYDLGTTSCESIARMIAEQLQKRYGPRAIVVTVDEDGENGAIVYEGDAEC